MLIAQPEPAPDLAHAAKSPRRKTRRNRQAGWRMLMTAPILLNLAFFLLLSIMNGGLNTYLVVALGALHGTPPAIANTALTALLTMNAVGVLGGGFLAGRTTHHAVVAALGLGWRRGGHRAGRVVRLSVGDTDLADGLQRLLRRRDLPVARHAGAFGDTARRVRQGVRLCQHRVQYRGVVIAPIVYGMLMDHGQPKLVFMLSAAVSIVCISTVTFGLSRREIH